MRPVVLRFGSSLGAWLLGHASGWQAQAMSLGLSLVSLALFMSVAAMALRLENDAREVEKRLAQITLSKAAPKPDRKKPGAGEESAAFNRVVRSLNTPWPALFDAVERHTPPEIALVSIEPDSERRSVRLQAEARGLKELLLYAETLRQAPPFDKGQLLRHDTNEQDPNRPVRLSFEVGLAPTRLQDEGALPR